jgi:hypothetical protein
MEMFISNDSGEKIGVKIDPAPECIAKMYAVGLDNLQHIVLEGVGQGGNSGLAYRPAADISNLFPPLLDVALNHLCSDTDADLTAISEIRENIAAYLSDIAHNKHELVYAAHLRDMLDTVREKYPDLYVKMAEVFMYSAMVAYSLAVKAKLKGDTKANINTTVYPMFALLSIVADLSKPTRDAVVNEMTEKHLWGL